MGEMSQAERRILASLDHYTTGRSGLIPAQIYAAGDAHGRADFSKWYITGPKDRAGFIEGPISPALVSDLARKGVIVADVSDRFGEAVAYILPKYRPWVRKDRA